ncbi:PDZ domain-containing protein [Sphingobacteriales bacterium UPWRP_1]|nr:hypothetical protein BVG80_11060 [Sphingobacteriales bacterium TSM_CSM]PSJ71908.1 PDZ domain-containing protein [Sphingobacteriales bacterium UPWRP_1]
MRQKGGKICHLLLWFTCIFAPADFLHAQFRFTSPERKTVRIPVEIQHNLILLPIKINNRIDVNFILDTGSRTTVITEPMLLNIIGVTNRGRNIKIQGLGQGDAILARLIGGIQLNMPEVEGHNMELVVLPPDLISFSEVFGKPVYGIIGNDLFSRFIVEINYRQKYIQLYNPQYYTYKAKGKTVKITLKQGKPYIDAVVMSTNSDTTKLNLLIDTGATHALTVFQQKVPLPDTCIVSYLGRGLSGDIMGKMGRLGSLSFGGFVMQQPVAGFPDDESLQLAVEQDNTWDGNLGGDIWCRFTVVINYPKQEMYLKPNSHLKSPFLYDLSGIQLEARGIAYKNITISYVRPNSAAAQAGILPGDELISVNGVFAHTASIGELYDMLNKKPGKKMKLKLRQNGKTVRKQFVLTQPI